jgi:hypothetical protein
VEWTIYARDAAERRNRSGRVWRSLAQHRYPGGPRMSDCSLDGLPCRRLVLSLFPEPLGDLSAEGIVDF